MISGGEPLLEQKAIKAFKVSNFSYSTTVNDESLEWLKFGRFGELIKFAKLLSTKMFENLIRQTLVTPNFRHLQYFTCNQCRVVHEIYDNNPKILAHL